MDFFKNYFCILSNKIATVDVKLLQQTAQMMQSTRDKGGKVILAGNGAGAAMASHVSVDLTKNAKLRAVNFNEADLLTCFSNDFGYEHWVEKAIEFYADPSDMIVIISSSGASKNMLYGAQHAKKKSLSLVTFSGFLSDNPLRHMGDINFWVDSMDYNVVEITHQAWLLALVDFISGITTKG